MQGLGCRSLSRILSSPFAGSPGTRRISMNRVASLVFATLVLLLNVTLTQAQPRCPADGEPSVPCDASSNCFHRCCLTSGLCAAFSCAVSLDEPNDAGTICVGQCQNEVLCDPFNPGHGGDCPPGEVCIGTLRCLTVNCGGRQEQAGSICLFTGEAMKVCPSIN
jgi:hypothetical protein